jgi:hypothetical protein
MRYNNYIFDTSDINTDDRSLRRTLYLQNIWYQIKVWLILKLNKRGILL